MDDYEEDLEEERSERDAGRSGSMGERPGGNRGIQILLGILIVVILAGGVYYFVKVRPAGIEENSIQTKLAAFEEKIASLEKQIIDNQAKPEKPAEDASLGQRLDAISQRVDVIERRGQSRANGAEKTAKPPKTAPPPQQFHTVKKGETLHAISKKYGMPVSELRKINHLSKDQTIQAGQKLTLVPLNQSNPGAKN